MKANRWLWRCALLSAVAASSCSSKASSVAGANEYIINCGAARRASAWWISS